jgi:predicted patatin/cPLA2 family phospholipase
MDAVSAKQAAKTTCRIPFIAGSLKRYTLWDGALAMPLPIEPAINLGATHVLVLRCATPKPHFAEPLLIRPLLYFLKPKLYNLAKFSFYNKKILANKYRNKPNVLFIELPIISIHSGETNETKLMQYALKGWHAAGETLQLPPLPYPALWRPTMERLGLTDGAEFA